MRKLLIILLIIHSSCTKSQLIFGRLQEVDTTEIFGFGDSIMEGFVVTNADSTWMNRIAASTGRDVLNYATNGAGVEYMSKKINEIMPVGNKKTVFLAAGLNDLQLTGNTAKNIYKIQECYRHAITSSLLETFVPADDASITITGATSIQDVSGDIYTRPRSQYWRSGKMQITFGNATISHDFTGTEIGFIFHHQSTTYPGSPITYIKIDGSNVDTLDSIGEVEGAAYTGGGSDMPAVRYYRGLSSGSHTIELVMAGFTDASARFFFDGFIKMQPTASTTTIIVGSPAHMMQERYDALFAGSPSITLSDAILDTYGQNIIEAVADEFIALGYNILKVDQNLYYTPNVTNSDDDFIHPNDTGHRLVFQAWSEVLP